MHRPLRGVFVAIRVLEEGPVLEVLPVRVEEQATVPVITGGVGICHLYVDISADQARSVDVIENAKVQRPSVCNALDTILVNRVVAPGDLADAARRTTEAIAAAPRAHLLRTKAKAIERAAVPLVTTLDL